MKLLKYLFILLILALLAAPFALALISVQSEPLVAAAGELTARDIERARRLIAENDPRGMQPGEMRSLSLDEADLNLLLNYAITQVAGGGARLDMRPGMLDVSVSVKLPENPLGRFVNLHLELSQVGRRFIVDSLSLGGLTIPGWMADPVAQYLHRALETVPEYRAALEAINGIRLTETRALLVYQWRPELVDRIKQRGRDLLLSAEDRERMLAYAQRLAVVSSDPYMGRTVPLIRFMEPLFQLAKERGGDRVEENRAVLAVLSMYISGVNIPRMLGVPEGVVEPPAPRRLTLRGRHDFAQHFITSAGIAASGGSKLADAVGLFKEIDDSQGGSGFSFNDLAADRAGVRFAEAALKSAATAATVQEMMAAGPWEDHIIPDISDLPEFMPAARFQREYGGVGSPRYRQVVADIERRISSCGLHRALERL
jgi:hypothetical protein